MKRLVQVDELDRTLCLFRFLRVLMRGEMRCAHPSRRVSGSPARAKSSSKAHEAQPGPASSYLQPKLVAIDGVVWCLGLSSRGGEARALISNLISSSPFHCTTSVWGSRGTRSRELSELSRKAICASVRGFEKGRATADLLMDRWRSCVAV